MKTKFTTGPWWVDKEGFEGLHHMRTITDGGCVIAHVESWDEEPLDVREQAKANAKAIAAVPNLIQALGLCLEYLDEKRGSRYSKEAELAREALEEAGVEFE